MPDYIYESGSAFEKTLQANEDQIFQTAKLMKENGIQKIILTGSGSSYTAALMAYPLMQIHSLIPSLDIPSTNIDYSLKSSVNTKSAVITIWRSSRK